MKSRPGATVFAHRVTNPQDYGVIEFDESGKVLSIEEKPSKPKSKYVIPGLYFYDHKVSEIAKNLKPSARGEDTGSIDSLHEAAEFVKVIEHRQGTKISVPEEIAWRLGYIDDAQLKAEANRFLKSGYGKYLMDLLQ